MINENDFVLAEPHVQRDFRQTLDVLAQKLNVPKSAYKSIIPDVYWDYTHGSAYFLNSERNLKETLFVGINPEISKLNAYCEEGAHFLWHISNNGECDDKLYRGIIHEFFGGLGRKVVLGEDVRSSEYDKKKVVKFSNDDYDAFNKFRTQAEADKEYAHKLVDVANEKIEECVYAPISGIKPDQPIEKLLDDLYFLHDTIKECDIKLESYAQTHELNQNSAFQKIIHGEGYNYAETVGEKLLNKFPKMIQYNGEQIKDLLDHYSHEASILQKPMEYLGNIVRALKYRNAHIKE